MLPLCMLESPAGAVTSWWCHMAPSHPNPIPCACPFGADMFITFITSCTIKLKKYRMLSNYCNRQEETVALSWEMEAWAWSTDRPCRKLSRVSITVMTPCPATQGEQELEAGAASKHRPALKNGPWLWAGGGITWGMQARELRCGIFWGLRHWKGT